MAAARAAAAPALWCSGRELISFDIECLSGSCLSHVAPLWKSTELDGLMTLEATYEHGVGIGTLRSYVDHYDGDLVLTDSACLSPLEVSAMLLAGRDVLGQKYATADLFKTAICEALRLRDAPNATQKYCCMLFWYMRSFTQHPIAHWETPELSWLDATVVPVCALLRNSA
jgi:hypothetical protein